MASRTTLRLGGPAGQLVTATVTDEIPQMVRGPEPLLILAGGSNVIVGDDGYPGTVVLLRTRGCSVTGEDGGVSLRIAAGESWDGIVARTVAEGWSGIECLSGIPGSVGATPIQNVGAYGQEIAERVTAVRVYDRSRDADLVLRPDDCGFGYRTSVFKHSDRWIVLEVLLRLASSPVSAPIRYAELARALGVEVGERAPLDEVRAAVLKLRAGKGMVLDPDDPDTYSVGSFFTNPVLAADAFDELRAAGAPAWPNPDGTVKTSAAWLIEQAGFHKGYGRNGVAISTKHTLALTNRGTGTAAALLDLAREIRAGGAQRFGVTLEPEPVLVNCAL
ncbi:MAG: UDP-N-acetylenolpyruvoylglucosamine reductase [Actinobacteria bacterium 13_2_20CM_2_71_6]|nr:MAG: UDP-N-acetylenolpyruvoylglucosamine reductase [Actinobacteria bacterium 13_2_20CM_2_71_6]